MSTAHEFVVYCLIIVATKGSFGKVYNLSMLAMIPFTGNEPRDGSVCRAAMEIAVDNANNRSDILRDYDISVIFRNEGANSVLTIAETIKFRQLGGYISPLAIGLFFSTGCQRAGAIYDHVDMAVVSTGCSSTSMSANRKTYPNLYHMKAQAEIMNFARLKFVTDGGRWDQIAILTNAGNIRDYANAVLMQMLLNVAGVQVPWFGSVLEMDDATMISLKKTDLRVILLEIAVVDILIKFFCFSHRNGITGNKYVFIPSTLVLIDPKAGLTPLPKGCTQETIVEQMKYVYFAGVFFFASQNSAKSSLGIDVNQFEELLKAKVNTVGNADYVLRHVCYDVMQLVLISLNQAENTLQQMYNASLKDFQTNPRQVLNVVNETIGTVEQIGLRVGRQVYSRRLEMDDDPQGVIVWRPHKGFEIIYVVVHNKTLDYFDSSSYNLVAVTQNSWNTVNQQPPVSNPPLIQYEQKVPDNFSFAIYGIAGFFSLVQLLATAILFKKGTFSNHKCFSGRIAKSTRFIIVTGCICLNASSCAFAASSSNRSAMKAVCIVRVACTVIGMTLLNAGILFNIILAHSVGHKMSVGDDRHSRFVAIGRRKHPSFTPKRTPQLQMKISTEEQPFCLMKTLPLFISNVITIIVWLCYDPPVPTTFSINGGQVYNYAADAYFNEYSTTCSSQNIGIWLGIEISLQAIAFIVGLTLSFSARDFVTRNSVKPFSLCHIQTSTVMAATILLSFILHEPIKQNIMYAIVTLLISTISFTITTRTNNSQPADPDRVQ